MIIFLYGHRHTGTTILRKIIGSHSQIYDYVDEENEPPDTTHENLVYKFPGLPTEIHDNCKRLMIIKNPYDVFGSIRLRFGKMSKRKYKELLAYYEKHVIHFLNTDDLKVKYEDLFDNGNLEKLFNDLGFEYEGLKDLPGVISSIHTEIPDKPPRNQKEGDNHAMYRQWQINQPFENMTGKSSIYCECKELIDQSRIINELYDSSSYSGVG